MLDISRKELDILRKKIYAISSRLFVTTSKSNSVIKRVYGNKDKNKQIGYTICDMKICLSDIRNQLELFSKEIHTIENNTPVPVKIGKFTRLQKSYVLLDRGMEMILRKFLYDQFLDRKLIGRRIDVNKIKLVSPNKKIKSTININKYRMSVIFRKKCNLKRYYSEISMNIISIITENVYSEIVPLMHKIINKMSYTEITNDKIITYSISEVICKNNKNVIYTK